VISIPGGDAVNGVAFSSDGKLLATANQSGRAYVWQVPSGLPRGESNVGDGQRLNSVAFDPANPDLVLTAGNDGDARLFKVSTDKQWGKTFGVPGSVMNAAAFSSDGSRIVTASGDGYARVWDAADQRQKGGKFGYGSSMNSAEFSRDGTEILTTEDNGETYIWDATQRTPTRTNNIEDPGNNEPNDAVFSPDGSVVTAGTDGTAREWDASTAYQTLAFAGHSGPINTVAFSGTEMITVSSDGTARIWDGQPIEQRGLLPGPSGQQIGTATFSPSNPRIVATANDDGTVSIWNTSDQAHPMKVLQIPNTSNAGGIISAEFSTDGKLLAAAGGEQVQIWRMGDLRRPAVIVNTATCPAANGNTPGLYDATFNDDGSLVVTADNDGSACVWNVSDGKLVREFTEPVGATGSAVGGKGVTGSAMSWAVFRPGRDQVLAASDDGTARLWDVRSGRQLQVFSEPAGAGLNSAWFNPDGTQIVTASGDGTARIWSVATGTQLSTLIGPGRDPVYNAAFSRDGKFVVTCSGSAAVIWSAHTDQQLTAVQYGNGDDDCEFSPDGSEIVTAGDDGQTRIFSTELAGDLAQIEHIADQRSAQPLTAVEQKEYQAGTS
jgi:WD40 repeat protein